MRRQALGRVASVVVAGAMIGAASRAPGDEGALCPVGACLTPAGGSDGVPLPLELWMMGWVTLPGHPTTDDVVLDRLPRRQLNVVRGPDPFGWPICTGGFTGYDRAQGYDVVWAKAAGYAPAIAAGVDCFASKYPTSHLDPIGPDVDATELCPMQPPAGDCRVTGAVRDPHGQWLPSDPYLFSSGDLPADFAEGLQTVEMVTALDGDFDVPPGTVLIWAPGYLPTIQCLQCGDYQIRLEPSPYVFVPPPKGCGAAPGAGADAASPFASAALAVLLALALRRER